MTEIYLACYRKSFGKAKLLIIKRLLPHLAKKPEIVKLFLEEASIIAKMNSPNMVRIYDLGKTQDSFYIIMEYAPGANLNMILQRCSKIRQHIPLSLALRIIIQVCQALHNAHITTANLKQSQNLLQGIVTPQNFVVTFDGTVKLVSLGIPQTMTLLEQSATSQMHNKFGYCSPEHCVGITDDLRSNVFSLGILFWELCTGRRLFHYRNPILTARAILSGMVEPPNTINPSIPREIALIVMRALNVDPNRRYQTTQIMGRILERETYRLGLVSGKEQLGCYLSHMFVDKLHNLHQILSLKEQKLAIFA